MRIAYVDQETLIFSDSSGKMMVLTIGGTESNGAYASAAIPIDAAEYPPNIDGGNDILNGDGGRTCLKF